MGVVPDGDEVLDEDSDGVLVIDSDKAVLCPSLDMPMTMELVLMSEEFCIEVLEDVEDDEGLLEVAEEEEIGLTPSPEEGDVIGRGGCLVEGAGGSAIPSSLRSPSDRCAPCRYN